jgi:hypothetical protein
MCGLFMSFFDIYNGDALPEDKEAPSVRSRARGRAKCEGVALESASCPLRRKSSGFMEQ